MVAWLKLVNWDYFSCTNKKQTVKSTIYISIENTKFQGLHMEIYE